MNKNIFFLQTIGIILVVVGHAFFNHGDHIACQWIYTFHMPLFFFISGYLLEYTSTRKGKKILDIQIKPFISKKAKRLLIPYLFWGTLVFLPKALLASFSVRPIDASFSSYVYMMVHPYKNVVGSLWFLPTLFMVFSIVIIMFKAGGSLFPSVKGKLNISVLLFLVVSCFTFYDFDQLLNIEGVIYYIFYFLWGAWMARNKPIESLKKPLPTFIVSLALSVVFVSIESLHEIHILCAANGIVMCMSASCLYEKWNMHFLDHLYGATFTIYIYHWFIQVVCFQLLYNIVHIPFAVAVALAIFGGLYLPLLFYKWIKSANKLIGRNFIYIVSGI